MDDDSFGDSTLEEFMLPPTTVHLVCGGSDTR